MRTVKLLIIASFAAMAFAAVGASVASAETPAILCLVAGCLNLEVKAEGGSSFLETLGGTGLANPKGKVTANVNGCKNIEGSGEKDVSLCIGDITFTEVEIKGGGGKCNGEGEAAGVVKATLDLHLGAEETLPGKELQPVLLAKLLKTLKLSCAGGLVKSEVKGAVGCLLTPGLMNVAATETVTLACTINTTTHDPETGMPDVLMEWLTEEPFEANLGTGFKDAWMNISLTGKPTKDIFIDD